MKWKKSTWYNTPSIFSYKRKLDISSTADYRESKSYICTMASIRQEKVSRVIQRELSTFFQQEARSKFEGAMITVTVVRVAPDLSIAKVYLSIWGVPDKQKTMELVEEQNRTIRHSIGQNLRHQLRVIPELHFYIDDSLDYAEKIENLLKK